MRTDAQLLIDGLEELGDMLSNKIDFPQMTNEEAIKLTEGYIEQMPEDELVE